MIKPSELELVHVGGERRKVIVVSADRKALYVAWPMCGVYRLSLKKNTLVRAEQWRAVDIDEAWAIYDKMKGNVGAKEHKKRPSM